jgi:hypothetical protein
VNTISITTALSGDTRSVSFTKDTTAEKGLMHFTGVERRKYQRFKAAVPINIGLIDSKTGKITHAQFKGMTTDISMEGLCLELNYPASEMLPYATKLIGENKQFDLEFTANLGEIDASGFGEARWARIHPPSVLKMGVLVKEMGFAEKQKWTNFVTSQAKRFYRHASFLRADSKHALIIFFPQLMQDLISSPFSINYAFPAIVITGSAIIYWLVQFRSYHLIISCGISATLILLTKSRIFSRYPKPRSEIPEWFLRKFCRRLVGDNLTDFLK